MMTLTTKRSTLAMNTLCSWGLRIATFAAIGILGGTGVASITPRDYQGHRSSLQARVTMTDGAARTIVLQGVGCTTSMCSRVAVRNMEADSMWLDGLTSVRDISHDPD